MCHRWCRTRRRRDRRRASVFLSCLNLSTNIADMNSHNSIKAICFDLDGTLHRDFPSADQIQNEFLAGLGVSIGPKDRLRAMRWEYSYWANSPDLRDDIIAHSVDTDKFWIEYTKRRL